jgi:hypothetical protein
MELEPSRSESEHTQIYTKLSFDLYILTHSGYKSLNNVFSRLYYATPFLFLNLKLSSLHTTVPYQILSHRDPTINGDFKPNVTWQLVGDDIWAAEPKFALITVCPTGSWRSTAPVPPTRRTSNHHQNFVFDVTSGFVASTHGRISATYRTEHIQIPPTALCWQHCKLFHGLVLPKLQQNKPGTLCGAWEDSAKWQTVTSRYISISSASDGNTKASVLGTNSCQPVIPSAVHT